jgi:hypothetical protein
VNMRMARVQAAGNKKGLFTQRIEQS